MATLPLAKSSVVVWLWHKHLSLSYWGIFPQYVDHSHLAVVDAMKDNYYQHLQLPSNFHQGTSILAMWSNGPLPQVYIPGPDNTVADALSRLPEDDTNIPPLHECWQSPVASVLSLSTDQTVLDAIKCGYATDEYCLKVAKSNMPGTKCVNGLWYIGDRLLIPHIGDIRENLFRLAHDTLGHFGADKSYAVLRDAYYWPNMWRNLEKSYIPLCQDCQRNKS